LGGGREDYGLVIVIDGIGNIYVAGQSYTTWGSPTSPHAGDYDAFVARIIDAGNIPPYQITLNRDNLYFGTTGSVSTSSQTFIISSNSSIPDVPIWSISSDQTWLSCNPTNGTGPGLVPVSVNPTGLAAGTYTGIITVTDTNAVKPFGAIDTPGQGGSAWGSSYRNWGWVLTPQPNLIPTNGATIGIWVDGINPGHPIYNIYRSDVAALFPGYGNTNGAGGYFDIDTTAYANGVHSISWTATDSGGNTDGMGSRYFSILNTGSLRLSAVNTERMAAPGFKNIIDIPLSYDDPVKLKKGYNDSRLAEEVLPDVDGIVPIRCQELERIELRVSHAGNKVEGYLVVGQRLKRLPIGSTLDIRTGKFNWIPGPGFIGSYRLVFVESDENGEQSRKEISVTIVPRGAAVGERTPR
jgi:hypothetical protein